MVRPMTQAQNHSATMTSANPDYAVPLPQADGSDYIQPVTNPDSVYIQRSINDHYRYPLNDLARNGWRTVPDRYYEKEKLYSDPDLYPAEQQAYVPDSDPRWVPPPVDRPVKTQSTYRFYRQSFGLDVPYPLVNKGNHFSMADHRRNYPVFGMSPEAPSRNTYRTQPPPRDVTIQDRPVPITNTTPQSVYYSPHGDYTMFGRARSYRL